MTFTWQTSPEDVFPSGLKDYTALTMDSLYDLMVDWADRVQTFMRVEAPWKDSCMPTREYLRAVPFRDDAALQVGIVAFYDLDVYRSKCGEPPFDWGWAHETFTFPKAGIIAIILPRGAASVLGDMADEVWDRVKALYS